MRGSARAFPWVVGGVALLLRVPYLTWLKDQPWFQAPVLDAAYYDGWARTIAGGDLLGTGAWLLNPGYAYFLGAVYALFGAGPFPAAVVQMGVGVATSVLVCRVGRRLGGDTAGLVSGLMAAASAPGIFFEGQLLSSTLLGALFIGAVWLVQPGPPGAAPRRPAAAIAAGAALGWAVLCRPSGLLVLLAVGWWAWRAGGRKAALRLALGAAIVLAPSVARNVVVLKRPVLSTVAGGIVLYKSNVPQGWAYFWPAFASNEPFAEEEEFRREASRRLGRPVSVEESSRYWTREAVRAVIGNPLGWLRKAGKKALGILDAREFCTNLDFHFLRRGAPVIGWPLIGFGLIAPLAAWGMFGAKRLAGSPLPSLVGAGVAGLMLSLVAAEYRLPFVPALCVLAGCGLVDVWARARERRLAGLAAAAAVLAVVTAAGMVHPFRPNEADSHYRLAYAYDTLRDRPNAVEEYRVTVRLAPENYRAWNNLGVALYAGGDLNGARAAFLRSLEIQPRQARTLSNLGTVEWRSGRRREGLAWYRKAVEADAQYVVAGKLLNAAEQEMRRR